jgi:multiple sugar transport system substrate-binding protein
LLAPLIALTLAACGGSSSGNSKVLTVAYGSDYVYITPQLATKWWHQVAAEFEAKHPGVTVKFIPIPGGLTDIVTKLNLLYRSPSTAPDVAELPSQYVGGWVSSGFLHPINNYVNNSAWWKLTPSSVKSETTYNGNVYGVNHGENTEMLYYNIPLFQKAGIPVPWQPKNWNDILTAAEKIHRVDPSIWPLWLQGGTAGGADAMQYDGDNFLLGSSTPTIYDAHTKKWVVDSTGLRQTLGFYSQLAKLGLQAPAGELLSPNAIVNTFHSSAQQKMGILVSGNFTAEAWSKQVCGPCFPAGGKVYGVAYIPTVNGTGKPNVASTLGGWDLAISASAPVGLSWDFIQTAQERVNMIDAANWAGWVPPDSKYWTDPLFVNLAPKFQTPFAKAMTSSQETPNLPNYQVWANGFGTATGQIIQNPSTTVAQAINTMKSYVSGQLGSGQTESLP